MTFPPLPQPKLVLNLATLEDVRLSWPRWWLHPKIVYPPKTVTYLRNNQTLLWLGIEPTTKISESDVLTTTPPSHLNLLAVEASLYRVVWDTPSRLYMTTTYVYIVVMAATVLLASVNLVSLTDMAARPIAAMQCTADVCLSAIRRSNTLNITDNQCWGATFGCCQMCWLLVIIFVPLETGMNTPQSHVIYLMAYVEAATSSAKVDSFADWRSGWVLYGVRLSGTSSSLGRREVTSDYY